MWNTVTWKNNVKSVSVNKVQMALYKVTGRNVQCKKPAKEIILSIILHVNDGDMLMTLMVPHLLRLGVKIFLPDEWG